jgi:hypothetical protein
VVTSLPFQSRRGESAAQTKQVIAARQKEVKSK